MDGYPSGRRRPGDAARAAGKPEETARAAAPTLPAPPETRGRPLAQQRCRCVPGDAARAAGDPGEFDRAAASPLRTGVGARAVGDPGRTACTAAPLLCPEDTVRATTSSRYSPVRPRRHHAGGRRPPVDTVATRRSRGRDPLVDATPCGCDALVHKGHTKNGSKATEKCGDNSLFPKRSPPGTRGATEVQQAAS